MLHLATLCLDILQTALMIIDEPPGLRKAIAKHMTRYFNAIHPVDPEHLLVANGVTSLCEMLGFTLFDPGNGLLLPQPIYQAFPIDFGAKAK